MLSAYLEQLDQLRHLSMSELESQLKRCKILNPSYHNRVLSPEKMAEYVTWMAEQFGGRLNLQFLPNDIPITTGGNIADIQEEILQSSGSAGAVRRVADIFQRPSEANFFSDRQSISASRFLRHMPAYWQSSEYFEIYYVFSGNCPVWFEGERITLSPGSVLLIPPQVKRACCCPEDDCVMLYYMIRSSTFSRVFWEQLSDQNLMSLFFRQALAGEIHTDYLRFDTENDEAIERLLYAVYREYQSNTVYSPQMTNSLLGTFFLYLLQHYEQTAQVSHRNRFHWKSEFATIIGHIQEHYSTVTLSTLADRFGFSKRQLIRVIQDCTGKNFTQLVTQLRMEKAAGMLAAKKSSTEQIAADVGYASLSSFYRVFVGYYGMTPSEWRRKQTDVS